MEEETQITQEELDHVFKDYYCFVPEKRIQKIIDTLAVETTGFGNFAIKYFNHWDRGTVNFENLRGYGTLVVTGFEPPEAIGMLDVICYEDKKLSDDEMKKFFERHYTREMREDEVFPLIHYIKRGERHVSEAFPKIDKNALKKELEREIKYPRDFLKGSPIGSWTALQKFYHDFDHNLQKLRLISEYAGLIPSAEIVRLPFYGLVKGIEDKQVRIQPYHSAGERKTRERLPEIVWMDDYDKNLFENVYPKDSILFGDISEEDKAKLERVLKK